MLSLSRQMSLLVLVFCCPACSKYAENDIKDYRLFFATSEPALVHASENLVVEFNSKLGFPALAFAGDPSASNSSVNFVPNLASSAGSPGTGQGFAETAQSSPIHAISGSKLQKTVTYSMKLAFDYDYFKAKATSDLDSSDWDQLFLLFCHEVGHGLLMADTFTDADKLKVMYGHPDDGDAATKNYAGYFQDVRNFLNIPAAN